MSDKHSNFRDEFYAETGVRWRPWKWFLSGVAVFAVVWLVFGFLGVLSLPFRTGANVAEKVGDADSVIFNYEHFHDLCAAARVFDTQIAAKRQQIEDYDKRHPKGDDGEKYAAVPKRDRLDAELQALINQRAEAVETYNADSAKANRALFKDRRLPERLGAETPICN